MKKVIKQHDERDCGAACLSMVATHYGLRCPISKYRELTKTDRDGVNLYGLVDGAQKIGFDAEALSGNFEELLSGIQSGDIQFPFVAHLTTEDNMLHFVVVFDIKKDKFIIGDPGKGKVKYTFTEFAQLWNEYIVTFKKTKDFQEGNYTKGGFRKFFSLLKGQYKVLATVLVLSLIISVIGIVGAFVFKVVIDHFYATQEAIIHVFFLSLIGLYVLQAVMQFVRGYLMSILAKNIDVQLMLSYYNHVMDLPVADLSTRNTGEYISRFSDASAIRTAISGATLTLLLDSIMVIACGVILFIENHTLFYISLIIILLYAIIVLCYRRPIEYMNRDVMENNARVQSFLKESIDGIETVKAHQAETFTKDKNTSKFNRLITSAFKNNIISASQDSICDLIELAGIVIILWVGVGMVMTEVMTMGSLITFYALLSYFLAPIKNLIALQPMMQTAIVAAERLNDILDISVEQKKEQKEYDVGWNQIQYSHVDFRYGNHNLILKDVSLDIRKGEKVAIVGESGSGKTTLAKLLMRFYTPEKGIIVIDGKDITDLSISQVRNSISYVDQNIFLFSDTIKNNLLMGNPMATDEEIKQACILAKADEFIKKLPFGYETYLDENGHNLSGGQRQRLAIARALIRKPQILIMDEATSHLDTITENAIKDTIFHLDGDLTCILIAHRLSTIQNCDKIIVMEDGAIVEVGTHKELLDAKGRYYQLYHRQ